GWLLLGDESAPGTVRRFFTREGQNINPASMPSLVVTYSAAVGTPSRVLVSTNTASVRAGDAFDVTVIVTDKNGNVATGYTGTIAWLSSDVAQGVVLPGPYMFRPTDAGVHTFAGGVTLTTFGDQLLYVYDTVSGINALTFVFVGF